MTTDPVPAPHPLVDMAQLATLDDGSRVVAVGAAEVAATFLSFHDAVTTGQASAEGALAGMGELGARLLSLTHGLAQMETGATDTAPTDEEDR